MICNRSFTLAVANACGAFAAIAWDGGTDLSERDNGGFYDGVGTGTVGGICVNNTFSLTASSPAIASTLFTNDVQQALFYWTGTFQYTGPALNCCISAIFNGTAPVVGVSPAPNGDAHCGFQILQDGNSVVFYAPTGDGTPQIISIPFTIASSPVPSTIDVQVQISAVVRAGFGNISPSMSATLVGQFGGCP